MKIISVVGARPQFIKAAPVSRALREHGHEELMIHTGQHYDHTMSQVFFDEMGIAPPAVNLHVGSGPHGKQTGQMLAGIEEVLLREKCDWTLVYGDTNSTLAGALAACKLGVPVAHVEAGLRSFNRSMPEEHNRILTDHCADLLLCPTVTAVRNLKSEGIAGGARLTGDTMLDAVIHFSKRASEQSSVLTRLALRTGGYSLATVHRPYNTDVEDNLRSLLAAFGELGEPVVFPVHPRTSQKLGAFRVAANVLLTEPVSYLDMLVLERNARVILTDSGGVQKEAFFFGVPCVTLRPETEWVETVESGWNVVTGTDPGRIVAACGRKRPEGEPPRIFGDGTAAVRIAEALEEFGSGGTPVRR
jgi:UDP-N-acetylglucosamine 2-epimerase